MRPVPGGLGLIVTLMLALGLAPAAIADPEGSHPLVDRPLPRPQGLTFEAPSAVLIWSRAEAKGLRLLGEAKLMELVSQRPELHAYSLEVQADSSRLQGPDPEKPLWRGQVRADYLRALQASRTLFILTVDRRGVIHRLSYVDHWPTLSVLDARFGPVAARRASWWQRLRQGLGLD